MWIPLGSSGIRVACVAQVQTRSALSATVRQARSAWPPTSAAAAAPGRGVIGPRAILVRFEIKFRRFRRYFNSILGFKVTGS